MYCSMQAGHEPTCSREQVGRVALWPAAFYIRAHACGRETSNGPAFLRAFFLAQTQQWPTLYIAGHQLLIAVVQGCLRSPLCHEKDYPLWYQTPTADTRSTPTGTVL